MSASADAGANGAIAERAIIVRSVRLATAVNTIGRAAARRVPLVVLPAVGFGWRDYRSILERFAPERRVAALDWPGFGGSDHPAPASFAYGTPGYASLLADWLTAIGGARVVLLGNGIGASVALRFTQAQPGRVAGLVLVGPWGFAAGGLAQRLRTRLLGAPWLLRRLEPTMRALTLGPANAATRQVLAAHREAARRQPSEIATTAALWRAFAAEADAVAAAAHAVAVPTIVLRGALDPVVSAAESRRATAAIGEQAEPRRGSALEVVLPEAGHLPFLQQPEAFMRAVAGLLESVEAGQL